MGEGVSVGRTLVVEIVVGLGDSEAGVLEAKSVPSEAWGIVASCSAKLGSSDLSSTLAGSCSSQEVLLRALSVERKLLQVWSLPSARLPALGPEKWGRRAKGELGGHGWAHPMMASAESQAWRVWVSQL